MAIGDDALAAGMTLVPGTAQAKDIDTFINGALDEIARRTSNVMPIARGGTGATSASGARTALDVPSRAEHDTKLTRSIAQYNADFAARDSQITGLTNNKYDKSGGTVSGTVGVTGSFYVGTRPPATFSYTIAYFNGDNQLCTGASSERYKKFIRDIDPLSLGHLFPPFKRWQMRKGEGVWRYGYTAEQLASDPATEQFVAYQRQVEEDGTAPHLARDAEGNPIPESIDFIGLLLAQVAQLHRRVEELEDARNG